MGVGTDLKMSCLPLVLKRAHRATDLVSAIEENSCTVRTYISRRARH